LQYTFSVLCIISLTCVCVVPQQTRYVTFYPTKTKYNKVNETEKLS